jgi:hypothetical protein
VGFPFMNKRRLYFVLAYISVFARAHSVNGEG